MGVKVDGADVIGNCLIQFFLVSVSIATSIIKGRFSGFIIRQFDIRQFDITSVMVNGMLKISDRVVFIILASVSNATSDIGFWKLRSKSQSKIQLFYSSRVLL